MVGDDPVLEVPMARRGKALGIAVTTDLASAQQFVKFWTRNTDPFRVDELLSLYRTLP